MANVPNSKEILPTILIAWVGRTIDDRQTTDGRAMTYSEPEREFTFAKKWNPQIKAPRKHTHVGSRTFTKPTHSVLHARLFIQTLTPILADVLY